MVDGCLLVDGGLLGVEVLGGEKRSSLGVVWLLGNGSELRLCKLRLNRLRLVAGVYGGGGLVAHLFDIRLNLNIFLFILFLKNC